MNPDQKIIELEKRIEALEKKATAATEADRNLLKTRALKSWDFWTAIISGRVNTPLIGCDNPVILPRVDSEK